MNQNSREVVCYKSKNKRRGRRRDKKNPLSLQCSRHPMTASRGSDEPRTVRTSFMDMRVKTGRSIAIKKWLSRAVSHDWCESACWNGWVSKLSERLGPLEFLEYAVVKCNFYFLFGFVGSWFFFTWIFFFYFGLVWLVWSGLVFSVVVFSH